ncbi:tape measure protein [Vibrio parahaemolyticus]|uniref:tape measure protein n=1 Tax=Vibrio parahaemolyticus TaxID=670 RepID=UPI00280D0A29|nr:tape measure protein [Vibrio parahaemolyticus]
MNNDLKFTLRFDAENKQFIGQVKQAGVAVDQLGGDAGKTQGKLSGLSRESDKLIGEMGSLKNQVLGLAGGFSALFAAQQAKDSLAQYQDIRTQITALVGGQQEWIETEQYLNQVSEDHNKTLIAMAGNYARLASLQEAGLLTQNQVRDLFEGMSNVQSQTGATTDQLGNSMYGLSQALASPIVRAEELNQVVEPMPGLLNKLDKAAGLASGGFRQMIVDGQVTSQFFKETLITALQDYDGAAARTADSVSAKSAEMARAYQQAVVAFEQPISDSFTVFAESSAGALTLLAENADLVTTIVGVSMSAAMGRGAAAVYVLTTAKLQAIAATHKQEQANYAELKSLAAKQQIEVRYLETLRQSNNQKFRAIGAESQLTAARQRLVTTTGALAAAQSRLNIASRAGSALLGILGGPAGIAMMAAGAIGYFALSSSDAAEETDNFSDRIDTLLGKMDKLQQRELSKALEEANTMLSLTQARIETLSKQRGTKDIDERLKQLETLRNEEESYSQAVIELEDKLYEIRNRPLDKPNLDTPEDDKLLESANKMLANLQKQNALYGQTTHAAKVKYELEHGSLKGINEELAKKLMLEAQSLDAKEATKKDKKDTAVIDAFYEESDQLQTAWLQRLSIVADMENKANVEEQFAYERRKEALSESFQEAYERAIGDQELMDALEREYFGNREILRAQHEMNLTDIAKKAEDKRKAYQYQTAMNTLNFTQQQLAITTDFLKQSGEEQSAMYRALFMVQKLAAIPSMIIATEEAATKALTLGPIAGPIASAAVKTLGYASVGIVAGQAFAGQAHDGINRVPRENEGTWLLKANEMVLNPTQADNFRWMVEMMQQMKAMMGAAMTASVGAPAANDNAVSVNVSGVDRSDNSSTNNVGSDLYLTLNLVEDASRAGTVEQSSDGDMTTLDIKVAKLLQSSSTQTAQVMQTRYRIQQYGG